uniref:G_PROTEIN_RECEP_F1_2 domain-containing protein n=1 Tax=Meloidogyne hapla TaxID=6305 RepID=A0A1I8C1V9_MELHA
MEFLILQPDTLVKLMLCTELGLNFAPQLAIFIIQLIIRQQIASIVGPINHFLNCFDALISVLTYRHTLRRFIGLDNSATTQTHNLHQQRVGPVRYRLTPKNSTENQIQQINVQKPIPSSRTTWGIIHIMGNNTRVNPNVAV